MNQQLTKILQDVFDLTAQEININLTKDDIAKWDSLAQMELVISLEREFSIQLDIEDMVKMDSVLAISETLKNKGIALGSSR